MTPIAFFGGRVDPKGASKVNLHALIPVQSDTIFLVTSALVSPNRAAQPAQV